MKTVEKNRIETVPFSLCLLCCSFLMSNHSTTCAFQFRLRSESQAQLIRSPSLCTSTFNKNIYLCSSYALGYFRQIVYQSYLLSALLCNLSGLASPNCSLIIKQSLMFFPFSSKSALAGTSPASAVSKFSESRLN